jgi:hypothetical protein
VTEDSWRAIITMYTGEYTRSVDVRRNPENGSFAIRAVVGYNQRDTEVFEFMTRCSCQQKTARCLEEVEFNSWPPRIIESWTEGWMSLVVH